jgi:hypothetical protein
MADNFDLKKFITESKIRIKVPVKSSVNEMARIAKELYKLNPDFPQIQDRVDNPSDFKIDRKQQVINFFIKKGEEQNLDPMEIELLKSDIEKGAAPGVNWSFTPDIRTQLLQTTSVKAELPSDEEGDGETYFKGGDAEDFVIGKSRFSTKTPSVSFSKSEEEEEERFLKTLKKDAPVISPTISDEEYDKMMKFFDLKDRLRNIESNIRQNKKLSRGGDDLSSTKTDSSLLLQKKDELEKRIEDLVASSPYLQRRQAPEDKKK